MAINYQISRWRSQFGQEAAEFSERQRLDAALQQLWAQIYSMLEANGLLDSKRAWILRHEYMEYCRKLRNEGLPQGSFRSDTFYLRENDKLGQKVIFRQSRIGR